jgi:hypothetical protein
VILGRLLMSLGCIVWCFLFVFLMVLGVFGRVRGTEVGLQRGLDRMDCKSDPGGFFLFFCFCMETIEKSARLCVIVTKNLTEE